MRIRSLNLAKASLIKAIQRPSTRPLPTIALKKRHFVTSSYRKMANYAVIASGGEGIYDKKTRERLPEEAEIQTVDSVYKTLVMSGHFIPDHIQVLFGKGVDKNDKSLKTFFSPASNTITTHSLEKVPPINGAFTFEQLNKSFEHLTNVVKNEDKIFIVLNSHGFKFKGICLWRDKKTEFLTVSKLESLLTKLPSELPVYLFIESCYSGAFLTLTRKNRVILTSTAENKTSYYKGGKKSQLQFEAMEYFFWNSHGILPFHMKGAYTSENAYALDSLSFWLNNKLNFIVSPKMTYLKKKYYDFNTYYWNIDQFREHFPLALFFINFCIDTNPIVTFSILLFYLRPRKLSNVINYFFNKINPLTRRDIYVLTHIRSLLDEKLATRPHLQNSTLDYLLEHKSAVIRLLMNIKKMSEQATDLSTNCDTITSYTLLFDKVVLYLIHSIVHNEPVAEIEFLLNMTTLLLNEDINPEKFLNTQEQQLLDNTKSDNNGPLQCFSVLETNPYTRDNSKAFFSFLILLIEESELRKNPQNPVIQAPKP